LISLVFSEDILVQTLLSTGIYQYLGEPYAVCKATTVSISSLPQAIFVVEWLNYSVKSSSALAETVGQNAWSPRLAGTMTGVQCRLGGRNPV